MIITDGLLFPKKKKKTYIASKSFFVFFVDNHTLSSDFECTENKQKHSICILYCRHLNGIVNI